MMVSVAKAIVASAMHYNSLKRAVVAMAVLSVILLVFRASSSAWVGVVFLSAWSGAIGIAEDTAKMPFSKAAPRVLAGSVGAVLALFLAGFLLLPHAEFQPIFLPSILAASSFVFVSSLLMGRWF